MKTFFKFFFILVFCAILTSSMMIFALLSSPRVMQATLKTAANIFLKDMTVIDLVIERQDIRFPQEFFFGDVFLQLKREEQEFDLRFKSIRFSGLRQFLNQKPGALAEIQEGSVSFSNFEIRGIEAHLLSESQRDWAGSVFAQGVQSQGFEAKNIQTEIRVRPAEIKFSNLQAQSYLGGLKGEAIIFLIPSIAYKANFIFEKFETEALKKINASLFSQMSGQIDGDILIQGPAGGFEKIKMNAALRPGARVQAQIFSPLLTYIPSSKERKNLQSAIDQKQLVSISSGQIQLSNQDLEKITTDIQLKSQHFNLDVNLTIDIIIEGGLNRLIDHFQQFSFFKKGF